MTEAKQLLVEIEEKREEFSFHKNAAHWAVQEDRCNGEFFAVVWPKNYHRGIRHLKNLDGSLTTSPEEMRQIASEFYQELLSADPLSEEILQSRDKIWSRIQPRVTEGMREALKAPLTLFELHETITMLPPHSCPGEDGLTPAFFLQYWDIIQEPLYSAFQTILGPQGLCLLN